MTVDNYPSRTRGDEIVRNHFDAHTDLYVDKYEETYKEMCRERLTLLKNFLDMGCRESMKILDVGCGAGVFVDMLLDRYPNAEAVGVDSSLGMLKRNIAVRRKMLLLGDAKELPFRPNSFDLINVDTVMHHLVDFRGYGNTLDTIEDFLSSLGRLLKPGGLLIVHEIYHEYLLRDNLGSRLVYEISTLHLPPVLANLLRYMGMEAANAGVCFLTRRQWGELFKRTHFEILQVREKHWDKHNFEKMGFRYNGDLYYTLRPRFDEVLSAGEVRARFI
ncbi:MAG: methyltransferase domain-containing protein [Candidatus Acidiferrum sp.]